MSQIVKLYLFSLFE